MIIVIAAIKVKEDSLDAFTDIFKANVPLVLKEEGCLEYTPTKDFPTGMPIQETQASTLTIVEKWESPDALKAHLKAPHMVEYQKKTKQMVEKVSIKVLAPV